MQAANKPAFHRRSIKPERFLALGFFLLIVAGGFVLTLRVLRRRADRGHPSGDVHRHLRRVRHGPVDRGCGRGAVLLRAGGAAYAHSGGGWASWPSPR